MLTGVDAGLKGMKWSCCLLGGNEVGSTNTSLYCCSSPDSFEGNSSCWPTSVAITINRWPQNTFPFLNSCFMPLLDILCNIAWLYMPLNSLSYHCVTLQLCRVQNPIVLDYEPSSNLPLKLYHNHPIKLASLNPQILSLVSSILA